MSKLVWDNIGWDNVSFLRISDVFCGSVAVGALHFIRFGDLIDFCDKCDNNCDEFFGVIRQNEEDERVQIQSHGLQKNSFATLVNIIDLNSNHQAAHR